jgi:hypothetical protein
MLGAAIRDLRAERPPPASDGLGEWHPPAAPLRAAIVGSSGAPLSAALLASGISEVQRLASVDDLSGDRLGSFDLVVVIIDAEPPTADHKRLIAAAATITGTLCAIECSDPVAAAGAVRTAGLSSVRRAEPPLDAERRYILEQRSLLLAQR